jgi:hypothetical protein
MTLLFTFGRTLAHGRDRRPDSRGGLSIPLLPHGPADEDGMSHDDTGPGELSFDAATHFIAGQPGGAKRLLDEHSPNDQGLCRGCRRPGTGTPHVPWPCPIAQVAQAAGELRSFGPTSKSGPAEGLNPSPDSL